MAITSMSLMGGLFSVSATLDDNAVGLASIGMVMHVSEHALFAERYKVITANKDTIKGAMMSLGFDPLSPDTLAVQQVFNGRVPVTQIVIGRRNPADPTWEAAFTSIKAALDVGKVTVFDVLHPYHSDGAVQREIAKAAWARQWLYHFTTPSEDVRNNEPDSVDKDIISDGSVCNMIYYDPAGQSGADFASVTTGPETYVLTGKDDTKQSVTLAMSVSQDGGAGTEVSVTTAKAVVTGTAAATFSGANGDKLVTGVDNLGPFEGILAATPATMDSGNAQPFALTDGQTVQWLVDGVSYTYLVAAANYGGNPGAATAAQIAADPAIPAPLAAVLTFAAVAGKVRVTTVHSGSTAIVRVGPNTAAGWVAALKFPTNGAKGTGNVGNVAAYTADELQAIIRAASKMLYATAIVPDANNPFDKAIQLVSFQYGTGAKVTIYNTSTPGMLAAHGLVAGVTAGSGDAVNGAAVTAAELYAKVSPLSPAFTVTNLGDKVSIAGTAGKGAYHSIKLVGPLADALGIGGVKLGPGIDDDFADYRWVGEMAGLPLDQSPPNAGHLTWSDVSAPGLYGDRTLIEAEQNRLNREQNVNVFILLSPSRGPEFADGRLSISFASGAPQYLDQIRAVRWFAMYLVRVFKANYDMVRDGNDQIGFTSEADYTPYVLTSVAQAEGVAVRSKALAFVDVDPPTPSKPTGVTVVPKDKLSPTNKGLRIGEVVVTARMGTALHGLLVQVKLSV